MAGRLRVSAALYVVIIATGIAATPLPGLPAADDQLDEHGNNANTGRRGREYGIDIGVEIHKMHLRMGKGYVHAQEVEGGEDGDINRVKELPLVTASNGSQIQDARDGNRLENQEMRPSSLRPDQEQDSRGTDDSKLTVELEDLQIQSGNTGTGDAPSELFALDGRVELRLGLEDELVHLEILGSLDQDSQASSRSKASLTLDSVGLEDELTLLKYSGIPPTQDSPGGSRSDAGLNSGFGGLEDELALLENSGSPVEEGPTSELGLSSGFVGLEDELELLEFLGSPTQDGFTSGDGFDSGFGVLEDELALLEYSGSPVDEGSTSGTGLNSGFGSLEDELALLEYSGSPAEDSPGRSPIGMSSTDEDLQLQLSKDQTPFSGEGSGSGKSPNDGFQDISLRPSLQFMDDVAVSGSGDLGVSKDRDRHNGLMFLSASQDGSSDGSGDGGKLDGKANQDITFTRLPQSGVTTQSRDESRPLDHQETPAGLGLDTKAKESHSNRSSQAERKEKVDMVVTLEEQLELELEGMSLVVSDVAYVNEDEEAASQEQVDPSQRTYKDYTTPVPRESSPSPASLEYVKMLTSAVPPLTMGESQPECRPGQMACADGKQCVPIESTCDMVVDCLDGSDEDDTLCEPSRICVTGFTKCGSSAQCVPNANLCDGIYHCYNGHDEKDCLWCVNPNGKRHMLTVDDLCDGVKDCADASDENTERCESPCTAGYRRCQDGLQCVKEKLFCNGVHSCRDGSDERNCERTPSECDALGMFACDGLCHPMTALCDYTYDCIDGSDENQCP